MTLRIEFSDELERVVIILTGRIQAAQVSELRALLKSESGKRSVVLDLKEVKLVDRDAVRFLAQIEAQGVTVQNSSPYIREWISQERSGITESKRSH